MKTQRILNIILAISGLLAGAGTVALAGVSTESPFAPRGFGAGGVTSNTPIELRGVMSDSQGLRFAIYDPAKKEGAWMHIDEQGQPYVVRSYDAATNRIVVDYQGRPQTLALADPKFGPSKSAAVPIAIAQSQGNVPPRPDKSDKAAYEQWKQLRQQQDQQQQQQAKPSQAESSRIDAIRAEIARRRAQRDSSGGQ